MGLKVWVADGGEADRDPVKGRSGTRLCEVKGMGVSGFAGIVNEIVGVVWRFVMGRMEASIGVVGVGVGRVGAMVLDNKPWILNCDASSSMSCSTALAISMIRSFNCSEKFSSEGAGRRAAFIGCQ